MRNFGYLSLPYVFFICIAGIYQSDSHKNTKYKIQNTKGFIRKLVFFKDKGYKMSKREVMVDQINVNNGDSALICFIQNEKLEKAILIDAGKKTPGRVRVLNFLEQKQKEFKKKWKLDSFKLQLDAIVVTHYDEDHLGGIVSLLNEQNFIPFLKETSPQTLFYDPGKYVDGTNPKQTALYEKYEKLINNSKIITHITSFDKADDKILGHELFWNETIDLKGGFATGMANLNKKNERYQENPALLCVAVNKFVPDSKTSLCAFPAFVGIVVSGGAKDGTTDKNQRSIALILISPQKEILHYLAGDLGETIEEDIVEWLGGYPGAFRAMKFSHHGGKFSTPTNLITQFKPQTGVISAGKDTGYRHPALELLLYIKDWNSDRISLKPHEYVLMEATNTPYYLKDKASFVEVALAFDYKSMEKLIQSTEIKDILEIFKTQDKTKIEQTFETVKTIWMTLSQNPNNDLEDECSGQEKVDIL